MIHSRRQNILSIYNGHEGLARVKTEDCLPSRCSETRAAVISGRVASGPSSPDAVSGLSPPDAHYSDRGSGKWSGGRRPSWVPRVRNNHCFSPRPRSWHLRKRARGGSRFLSFVLSFVFSLARFISSCDRPWWRAKGYFQLAAIARTAGIRTNVRHRSLDRLNASMINQKKSDRRP